jgi:hypothetical protein
MINYMYAQGIPVEIQTPTHRILIGPSMNASPLCYRPAVSFRQLSFITLAFPQGKIDKPFKSVIMSISSTFLKLRKLGCVCI